MGVGVEAESRPLTTAHAPPELYGGFMACGMSLAMPVEALREVVPIERLLPLPSAAACVLGAIDLRGVAVPLIDLERRLAGREGTCDAASHRRALVMVHEGRLMALLVQAVSDVFTPQPGSLKLLQASDGGEPVLSASLRRPDGTLVLRISPAALAETPGLDWVEDPEPGRQWRAAQQDERAAIAPPRLSLLLVRCGRAGFVLDAMHVTSTLARPTLKASPLSQGVCRGVIEDRGIDLPAVDVLALLKMGERDAHAPPQAAVVEVGEPGEPGASPGLRVALLVDEVIDVAAAEASKVLPLPMLALPRANFFNGVIPASALGRSEAPPQFLMLDAQALRRCEELVSLAQVQCAETAAPSASRSVDAAVCLPGDSPRPQRPMITYEVMDEIATPIEQVKEILRYTCDPMGQHLGHGARLGLVVHRDRSIPVLCLRRVLGGPPPEEVTDEASVLVVESRGEWIGFAVPRLCSIDDARWEPQLRAGPAGSDPIDAATRLRKMALVGNGARERMLRVLDLQDLAAALQASMPDGAAPARLPMAQA